MDSYVRQRRSLAVVDRAKLDRRALNPEIVPQARSTNRNTACDGGSCTPVTANASTSTGHHLVKWRLGGSDYSTSNPLTVINVTANMTLTQAFLADPPPSDEPTCDRNGVPLDCSEVPEEFRAASGG